MNMWGNPFLKKANVYLRARLCQSRPGTLRSPYRGKVAELCKNAGRWLEMMALEIIERNVEILTSSLRDFWDLILFLVRECLVIVAWNLSWLTSLQKSTKILINKIVHELWFSIAFTGWMNGNKFPSITRYVKYGGDGLITNRIPTFSREVLVYKDAHWSIHFQEFPSRIKRKLMLLFYAVPKR